MSDDEKKQAVNEDVKEMGPGEATLAGLFGAEIDSLDNYGVKMLMDDIKSESVRPVIEWILKNNLSSNQFERLTLIINSGGGSVTDAFALIDTMKGSGVPISTVGLGEISSAALMIFMAGDKGNRILTPNTSILSHQYSWGKWGKEHELVTANKAFDLTSKMIMDHYAKCTGMSEKKIREVLLPPHDIWLSAKEAKKHGICDDIKELY
jgi:ATP-dependent Clp protease protease subunit